MKAQYSVSAAELRKRFYGRISEKNLTPLWEVLDALVPPHPRPRITSALWRFTDVYPSVLEAGELITAQEAERRVLILENPAARGASRITQSLYAGLQLILPGEIAPAHRHAQSALRLLLKGSGAYTAVDGERVPMHRGDFIITPPFTFHDHGNLGSEPVTWLDGLDIPIVEFFDAGFGEKGSAASQTATKRVGDSLARYGHNMVPMDYSPARSEPTKLVVYPYAQTRSALSGIAHGPIDAHWGYKLRYINPATGESPMLTIGAAAQYLPAGFNSAPYRSTDSTIYVCLEGHGNAQIDDTRYQFEENDVFVVPSWATLGLNAPGDVILFSFSDRPVQRALGLWREEKLRAPQR